MRNRYTAILLSIALVTVFAVGLFMKPSESQANPGTGWKAEYFNNTALSGTPAVTITQDQISFNWAENAPVAGIPADNFSVRWTAAVTFTAGTYRFRVGSDDGLRLYIDDIVVIDQWTAGNFRTQTRDVQLSAGSHNLRVEYFEAAGLAGVLTDWGPIEAFAPTATPGSAGPTPTPVPTVPATAHIATGVLNVRANPSVTATRISQVYLYQRYPILGISPDGAWYLIQLRDGRTGWVMKAYIYRNESTPVPTVETNQGSQAAAPNIQVVGIATSELKVRLAPRTGEQIGLVPLNAQVIVLGRTSSGAWYFIDLNGLQGWVYAPFVKLVNGRVMDVPIR